MPTNYNEIPEEMRVYRQWIVWRYEHKPDTDKPTKVPYNPYTGKTASVTNPQDWATFEDAVAASHLYSGLGFVLTRQDPYAFIDLDDPEGDTEIVEVQTRIYDTFTSYAERSPSGNGLHIITRGSIAVGRRRGKIELYTEGRYMTMTGDVFRRAPITEHLEPLHILWEQLGGAVSRNVYTGELTETYTDFDVHRIASEAVNGDKFSKLYNGDWQNDYTSQSEADQALMNILAYYTQNRTQLMRIFRTSALGQRDKAKRDAYVTYTINKAFDRMLPSIDLAEVSRQAAEVIALANTPQVKIDLTRQLEAVMSVGNQRAHTPPQLLPPQTQNVPKIGETEDIPLPPGRIGDLARFIYSASPRPVSDISLTGALALTAGIVGRSFNISGAGLNAYFLLMADTGVGKEAMARGIEKFMAYVKYGGKPTVGGVPVIAAADVFMGPAEIASGQALIKYMAKTAPCFVSILGEFGITLQQISGQRSNNAEKMLQKMLLALYSKSGITDVFRPMIHADESKNTSEILAPSFTILGETTPLKYYEGVDEDMISSGLIPRFIHVHYKGPRKYVQEGYTDVEPDIELVKWYMGLVNFCLQMQGVNQALPVAYDYEVQEFFDSLDRSTTDEMNVVGQNSVSKQMWSRVHLKVMKMAALVAIGCTDFTQKNVQPRITMEHAQWAYAFIERETKGVVGKFEIGDVGRNSHETQQVRRIIDTVTDFIVLPYNNIAKYGPKRIAHQSKLIPLSYIQRRLGNVAAFKNDRIGATNAIKRTLTLLCDEGALQEVGQGDLSNKGLRGRHFVVVDPQRFSEKDT